MADTLVIYYSLEGNVDFAAHALAKELGADTFRLETVKEYPVKGLAKFFHGGKDSTLNLKPELKNAVPNLAQYGTVVIGAPVWAGKPAAPINTLLASSDFTGKKVAVFASSAGGNAGKTFAAIGEALKGAEILATESLKNPARTPESSLEQIMAFAARIKAL